MNGVEELWTPQEVADYLKVTERTVYRWIEAGELPAFKVGRQWRVTDSDVKARLIPRAESRPRANER